ncbi:hypothetical protein ACROYT_G023779 [Oculina patagonica]
MPGLRRRFMDTVTKLKNLATDKIGKAMENARLMERVVCVVLRIVSILATDQSIPNWLKEKLVGKLIYPDINPTEWIISAAQGLRWDSNPQHLGNRSTALPSELRSHDGNSARNGCKQNTLRAEVCAVRFIGEVLKPSYHMTLILFGKGKAGDNGCWLMLANVGQVWERTYFTSTLVGSVSQEFSHASPKQFLEEVRAFADLFPKLASN